MHELRKRCCMTCSFQLTTVEGAHDERAKTEQGRALGRGLI